MQNVVHKITDNKLKHWRAIAAHNGTKSEVARISGVSRLTLDNVLKSGRGRKATLNKVSAAFEQLGTLTIS